MKIYGRRIASILCFAAGLALAVTQLPAQDPLKVAPNYTKLLLENDHVRVFSFRAKPGEKEPMHDHPAHVIYVVRGGKAKFTAPDGKVVELDLRAGQAVWGDPTKHAVEVIGSSEIEVIAIELKGKGGAQP